MKSKKPVIAGIFIIVGLATFAVAVFTLGEQKKTFVKSFTVNAIFDDVGGLQAGNNIWFSGVKIGTVRKISFYKNAQVLVSMNIEKSIQSNIPGDAMVKIGSDGLIGNKIIIITGGTATARPVEPGDFLKMKKTFSTNNLIDTLSESNSNLLDITKNIKSISKKVNSGNGTAAMLVNDSALANNFKEAVGNLRAAISNFKLVSLKSRQVLTNLQDFSAKLDKQGTLLNQLVTDTIVFNNIKNSAVKLNETVGNASTLASNLKNTSESLSRQNNTAGLLLNDSSVALSLKNTLKNLETSSKKLDENLEALQHNFLFRGYFRKKARQETPPVKK